MTRQQNPVLDQIASEINASARLLEQTNAAIASTPALDTADLWRLFRSDAGAAWGLLAGLSAAQLVNQAVAMAAYLFDHEGKLVGAEKVLSDWQTKLAKQAEPAPTPTFDAVVAAALERLAAENAQSARTARYAGEKEDATFFQRAANSFTRALGEWTKGARPERTPSGGWLLPSRSGGADHLLTLDGDWMCSCPAGESMHWAKALVIGMEVASDDLDRFDDGGAVVPMDDPEPGPSSPAAPAVMLPADTPDEDAQASRQALIRRLTEARAEVLRRAA